MTRYLAERNVLLSLSKQRNLSATEYVRLVHLNRVTGCTLL